MPGRYRILLYLHAHARDTVGWPGPVRAPRGGSDGPVS